MVDCAAVGAANVNLKSCFGPLVGLPVLALASGVLGSGAEALETSLAWLTGGPAVSVTKDSTGGTISVDARVDLTF